MPDYRMSVMIFGGRSHRITSDYAHRWQCWVLRLPLFGRVNCRELYFGKSERPPLCFWQFIPMYGRCLSDVHSNDISANFWRSPWIKITKASRSRAVKATSLASRVSNPAQTRDSRHSSLPRSPARTQARPEFEGTPPSGGVLGFRSF